MEKRWVIPANLDDSVYHWLVLFHSPPNTACRRLRSARGARCATRLKPTVGPLTYKFTTNPIVNDALRKFYDRC